MNYRGTMKMLAAGSPTLCLLVQVKEKMEEWPYERNADLPERDNQHC